MVKARSKTTPIYRKKKYNDVVIGLFITAIIAVFVLGMVVIEAFIDYQDEQRFEALQSKVALLQSKFEIAGPTSIGFNSWVLTANCSRSNVTFGDGDASCRVSSSNTYTLKTAADAEPIIEETYEMVEDNLAESHYLPMKRIQSDSPEYPNFEKALSVSRDAENNKYNYGSKSYRFVGLDFKCHLQHSIRYFKDTQQPVLNSRFSCAGDARETWFPRSDCSNFNQESCG